MRLEVVDSGGYPNPDHGGWIRAQVRLGRRSDVVLLQWRITPGEHPPIAELWWRIVTCTQPPGPPAATHGSAREFLPVGVTPEAVKRRLLTLVAEAADDHCAVARKLWPDHARIATQVAESDYNG